MLLGVLLTGTLLTGCGKNKATEAASESAQTEKEGTGERTADSAEDDQKKTDETADTKTDKKAEKGTDAEENRATSDAEKEGFLYAPIEFGAVAESAERLESLTQTDDHRIGKEGDAGNDAHARNGCIAKRTCCHIEHQRSDTSQSLS